MGPRSPWPTGRVSASPPPGHQRSGGRGPGRGAAQENPYTQRVHACCAHRRGEATCEARAGAVPPGRAEAHALPSGSGGPGLPVLPGCDGGRAAGLGVPLRRAAPLPRALPRALAARLRREEHLPCVPWLATRPSGTDACGPACRLELTMTLARCSSDSLARSSQQPSLWCCFTSAVTDRCRPAFECGRA